MILHIQDLIKAIANEYLGLNLQIINNQIFLEDHGLVGSTGIDASIDQQDEAMEALRKTFYEDFEQ